MTMTMKLPQKAGFVATPDEWDALVRIAENLAAQVVQRDAALREMVDVDVVIAVMAERDAARAEVARLTAERAAMLNVKTTEGLTASEWLARTAKAEAEVARLTSVIGFIENELQMSIGVGPFWDVMHDVHLFRGSLIDLCLAQLPEGLRQPAPAKDDARADRAEREVARLTAALKEYGWHLDRCPAADCSTTKCECGYAALRQPAPAQPDATMLSDNSLQTSSQAPSPGQE